MKAPTALVVLSLLLPLALPSRSPAADEEKVEISSLPAPVLDFLKGRFPAAELKGATHETSSGEGEVYEVAMIHGGGRLEVNIRPDGTLVHIEREIVPNSLPAAVMTAIQQRYPQADLRAAEEVIEATPTGERVTRYDVDLVTSEKIAWELVITVEGVIQSEQRSEEETAD